MCKAAGASLWADTSFSYVTLQSATLVFETGLVVTSVKFRFGAT